MFDLIENKEIAAIPGSDPVAFRSWGDFDSSALINWQTDTLLEPGENGLFYKVKPNSHFDPDAGMVSLNPEFDKLRYRTDATSRHGIESSPVAYRNLIYFADNDGNIVCLDVNTLEPVWLSGCLLPVTIPMRRWFWKKLKRASISTQVTKSTTAAVTHRVSCAS